MRRREFIARLGGASLAWPVAAYTRQAKRKNARIGFLSQSSLTDPLIDGLRQGLREADYVEGHNLRIEWRAAEGDVDRLPQLAADLVKANVELIATLGGIAAFAAQRATTKIPIVFTLAGDPVGLGLVRSLARPDGNITGVTAVREETVAKELELLREFTSSVRTVTLLTGPRKDPGTELTLQKAEVAARALGLTSKIVEISDPDKIEHSFAVMPRGRAHGVLLVPGPWIFRYRVQIMKFATRQGNPTVGWHSGLVESGALFSYGASNFDIGRRAAAMVAKILGGARPADIPVEEPIRYELAVNLRTAKALALTIPKSVLGRADKVIE